MRLFGWFRRPRDKDETSTPLSERVSDLERTIKSLRLEWDDTYEQLAKVSRKLAKRDKREAEDETPNERVAPDIGGDMSREQLRAIARARGLMR